MAKRRISKEIRAYFSKMGKKGGDIGGHARARLTTPEQRKEWARMGGLASAANRKAK